ncbi:MAG TPA: 50S ribosomal protein L25 [Candidatus Saccharimonadales bacterium]|jgi:large subunit ribosomal protein L25
MSQDKIALTLEARTVEGKAVKHLRKAGIVPAVVHDHGKDSVLVQGDVRVITKAYKQAGKHHPIQLSAAGKNYTAMIKTIEFEPRKQALTHVVFNAVSATEKVETEVPLLAVFAEGNESSPAERSGLLVLPHLTVVTVQAISSKLPDVLEYDAEKLVEVGDHVTVGDLVAPAGVEIMTDPAQVIVTVNDPTVVAAANDAAGGDAEEATGDEAAAVDSEHGSAETDDQTSGADEIRPGGKKEFEDKTQGHNPEKH